MKEVLREWFKKTYIKIIINICFIFLNIYLVTYPPKIIGIIVDLLCDIEANKSQIYKYVFALIGSSVAILLSRLPWRLVCANSVLEYERIIKNKLFSHFMKIKLKDLQNIKNGEIMTYFTKDINETRRFINSLLALGTRIIAITLIATYSMIKSVNLKLTIITLSPICITLILVIIIKNLVQKASEKARTSFSNLSEYVQESTDGIRTIKAYCGEEIQIREFLKKNQALRNSDTKVGILSGLLSTIINIGFGTCIGISILFGSQMVLNKEITMGALIAFNGCAALFINPVMWLPQIITKYKVAKISFERLSWIFNLEEEKIKINAPKNMTVKGDIEINDLSFNYPCNIEVALKNIDLKIKEGETLGIIGTIGSGKTTLMNLLLRLYQVPDGKIFIGGQDINEIDINDLRNSICYITQEHFLFSTTIKENISLFRDYYTAERIEESTKSSLIYDDISRMSDGINTVVGERGIDLSGGQKQRVVISRAFLQNSNIVIFDDTFSALDNKTEEFLLDNIRNLTKNKTCIIISNRISDVKDADNIIVLDDGYIIQSGNHEKLVKEDGLYKKFYNQQASKNDAEVGELIG